MHIIWPNQLGGAVNISSSNDESRVVVAMVDGGRSVGFAVGAAVGGVKIGFIVVAVVPVGLTVGGVRTSTVEGSVVESISEDVGGDDESIVTVVSVVVPGDVGRVPGSVGEEPWFVDEVGGTVGGVWTVGPVGEVVVLDTVGGVIGFVDDGVVSVVTVGVGVETVVMVTSGTSVVVGAVDTVVLVTSGTSVVVGIFGQAVVGNGVISFAFGGATHWCSQTQTWWRNENNNGAGQRWVPNVRTE